MAIHKTGKGYVISSRGVWLPGCYEDERAARFAFRLPDEALAALRDRVNRRGNRVATWGDVAKAAEACRAPQRMSG